MLHSDDSLLEQMSVKYNNVVTFPDGKPLIMYQTFVIEEMMEEIQRSLEEASYIARHIVASHSKIKNRSDDKQH